MTILENSRPSGLDGGAMPATLSKAAFRMDRAMEFFTTKELSQQIGAPPSEWPKVILKELIDNSLDACEAAGVSPAIDVNISTEANTLVLKDNGPGLPRETLLGSLDYSIRVSDKAKRVAPSRGALGNALKCLWAAPFVLDGHRGKVTVDAPEGHFEITVTLDEIAQRPVLDVVETEPTVTIGTKITVKWPGVAS